MKVFNSVLLAMTLFIFLPARAAELPYTFLSECHVAGGLGLTGNSYFEKFELYRSKGNPIEGILVGRSVLILGRKNIADTAQVDTKHSRQLFKLKISPFTDEIVIDQTANRPEKWTKGGLQLTIGGEKQFNDDFIGFRIPLGVSRYSLNWGSTKYFCTDVQ